MRMYTLHFGQGLEHTQHIRAQAKSNLPFNFTGWDNGTGGVPAADCQNSQIVSHKEIFDRFGIKGGYGDYCLEVWSSDVNPALSCQLHTGGYGDIPLGGNSQDVKAFYFKFDFMYTDTNSGTIFSLQRSKTNNVSKDFVLSLSSGFINVIGHEHITQPVTDPPTYPPTSWIPRLDGRNGSIFLEPNKWHEIQIFLNPYQGWGVSKWGYPPGLSIPQYNAINPFVSFFQAFETIWPNRPIPEIDGSETLAGSPVYPLQLDLWPANGHPQFPNTMLPGQNQAAWPPENQASGQFFYGENLGMVYVWINGKLDIQHTTNMANEQTGWTAGYSQQSIFLGYSMSPEGRFFYDNIIMNDIRDPSGSHPSKIFNPLFSSHETLEWNPGYNLKFVAMEMDPNFWEIDALGIPGSRKHNTWLPNNPLGALVPSGEPYYVPAPNRFGSATDSMIPHGTKLTVIHTDWNGDKQEYTVNNGNRNLYPDYNVDYAYQNVQPNESNPFAVNQDDPNLKSIISGNKVLFNLKRPPAVSGEQPLAGGFGLGGTKDYIPNIFTNLGETNLPPIYRIWTCIQDHTIGTNEPIDLQYHLIRVPSGVSGHIDYISDNQCPGDFNYRAYHNNNASLSNSYSMSDWPYNPITGDPWTWDDLEKLQIGVYHGTHLGNNSVYTYTVYLVVEHGSPINPKVDILGNNLLDWDIADGIPFNVQQKNMYNPGWKFYEIGQNYKYYNRWNVSPAPIITRSNQQTTDGQSIIDTPQYSGTIQWDYSIRYINGEIIQGDNFRKFDEHFDEVFVYTISGINPSGSLPLPMRKEIIVDNNNDYFTFLTYPVLQWNTQKFPTDPNLSPLDKYPYIIYDYNTLYVIPLTISNVVPESNIDYVHNNWTSPHQRPRASGQWIINTQENTFKFKIDQDSYFHPFSPSSVVNHALTHPGESLDYTFPISRDEHDYYFQAPDLASGSVTQIIHLIDKFGIPEIAIDLELYKTHIGLYQTTVNQTINDTGEGRFDFYNGSPGVDTFISGYTFGPDGTAGWHLNEDTVVVPSGTRQVKFTFHAIRNTEGPKSPGSTLGGTSNFASFDEPFFILSMSSKFIIDTYHPADIDQDNRIVYDELVDYILLWQSGIFPPGVAKDYLTKAENIWQRGKSTHFNDPSGGLYFNADDGPRPENWMSSSNI